MRRMGRFAVLEDLREWSWPGRAAIVIRHAERPPIRSARGNERVGLTESGAAEARELGRGLARYPLLNILYSPVLRCEQTAEAVGSGATEAGAVLVRTGREKLLGGSYIIDHDRALTTADELGNGFVRAWFSGTLSPGLMISLGESLRMHVEFVRQGLAAAAPPEYLNVHVTHDWNVSVLREGLFGVRNEDVGWPGYLDGVAFSTSAGRLNARYRSQVRLEIP